MAQFLFPEKRDVFVYYGPGEPIRQSSEVGLWVYSDEACTTKAYVEDLSHAQIPGSLVFVTPDGLLPQFYGADGVDTLYAKGTETDVYRLDAGFASRLDDALEGSTQAMEYVDQQVATRATPGDVAAQVSALRTEVYGGTVDSALDTIKELGDFLVANQGVLQALLAQVGSKLDAAQKAAAGGVAPLGPDVRVPESFLPAYLSDAAIQARVDQAVDGFTHIRTYATEQDAEDGLIAGEYADGDLVVVMSP